jgi:hypothetical protein
MWSGKTTDAAPAWLSKGSAGNSLTRSRGWPCDRQDATEPKGLELPVTDNGGSYYDYDGGGTR